jgi:hypothetical protein
MVINMEVLLKGADGSETRLVESDWENLVHLLEAAGADLVELVSMNKLDAEAAKKVGENLSKLDLECVETSQGTRVRVVGGQDTDPMLSVLARIAEGLGDEESAAKARKLLLDEMATLVVRPLNEEESSKVAMWSKTLLESGGVLIQR